MEDEIFNSVGNNDFENLKILIEFDLSDINYINDYGETPLMLASGLNRYHMIKYLLDNGADINMQNDDNNTALIIAIASGNIDSVEILLKYNPDINISGEHQYTALMMAEAYVNNINGIEILHMIKNYILKKLQALRRGKLTRRKLKTSMARRRSALSRLGDTHGLNEDTIQMVSDMTRPSHIDMIDETPYNMRGSGSLEDDSKKDCCRKYRRCKKISESQQRAIDRITEIYEDKLFEDMDRMDEQESMENNAMAYYLKDLDQYGGNLNDLAIELIDEQLEKLNCKDRLSYCQTNRKSRDHCNREPTLTKYIKPCRKKSKMNKTKRRAIEVSKRLQKKNQLESQLQYKQREIQRSEERQEREFLERLRQPRDIAIRRNTEEDFEFDDD
jgi:hypothetical protein